LAEFAKPIETAICMPKQHLMGRTCAMARDVICCYSRRPGSKLSPTAWGLVVAKVALAADMFFSDYFRFHLSASFHQCVIFTLQRRYITLETVSVV